MTVRQVTLGDERATVHADALTLRRAATAAAGAGVVVSVGSGTIADIGKALSAELGRVPHVVVQTAASVNGFADDQSVLLLDGVKHTTATRWPERLVIDTDVIARAPVELNRAGFGDLLATYTAPADWRLAQLVGQDDSYSPFAVELARAHVDAVLDHADGIHRADPEALEHLSAALTLSGIAMGVAGRTAPGSGMEHTVSHLLEMAERPGVEAPLHGAKVGALSVLAAMLWARVRTVARAGGLRALRFPTAEELEPRVREAFAVLDPSGRVGEACWRDYARKLERWNDARDHARDAVAALAGVRRRARPPAGLAGAARRGAARGARAGAPDPARRARPHGPLGARARAPDARPLQRRRSGVLHGHLGLRGRRRAARRRGTAGSRLVIEFVFMLTRDDVTVGDAAEVLASLRESGCATSASRTSGRRRRPSRRSPRPRTTAGMEVMLEVVSTSAEDELRSLRAALDIGVDWVLGGTHAERGRRDPRRRREVLPVPGHDRRPSRACCTARSTRSPRTPRALTALDGVHGVDLLAYRHATEDPIALTRAVAAAAAGPGDRGRLGHVLRADRRARRRRRVGLHDRVGDLRRPAPRRAERARARSRPCWR